MPVTQVLRTAAAASAAASAASAGSAAVTTTVESFVARYGWVFVWHGASAAAAWLLLGPLGYAWMRAARRAGAEHFRSHRVLMLVVLLLTVQAWGVAVGYEERTPPVHAQLGSLILFLAVLQASWGAMRPAAGGGDGGGRSMWLLGHRVIAVLALITAAYTCHHSIYVFKLPGLAALAIHAALMVSVALIVAAEATPTATLRRALGVRGGYFDEEEPDELLHKLALDDGGSALGFRVVEEDDDELDDDALSLMRPEPAATNGLQHSADNT